MAASERRIANVRDVVTGGTVLMLAVIILDVYAPSLLSVTGLSLELVQFRVLLFVSVAVLVLNAVLLARTRRDRS
ncbi:hypothetical protein RYH80_04695 [Halobaculum sp. MBLA0147]|uniref:hypothetical protein n=1 Tax=Halobaculum sp. MBLA0147 TaxID=3079934 RepID=UPI003525600F